MLFKMTEFGDVAFLFYNITLNCSHLYPYFSPNETNCTFPQTPDGDFVFFPPPAGLIALAKVIYGLIGFLGLIGNSLVIYVVCRFSKMQTVTNIYILNLSVADALYLSGMPFLLITMYLNSWPFGGPMCKVYMTMTSINQFTSSLLLTVMSADRYIAVCHPIQSPRFRTPFIAKFICLTAWTCSALLMVPIYMYASALETGDYINCNIYWPENSYMNGEMAFTLYAFTLGFAVPLVLILTFYFLVICKLRTVGPKNKSKEKKKTHRKVTYLVLAVVTVYIICWLPYWSAQLWLTFIPPESSQTAFTFTMMLLTQCLSYANSTVNPILYAFLSDNFKKSFAKAFTCASRREVNAQLHVENSLFPKTKSGSSRQGEKKGEPTNNLQVDCQEMEQSTGITLLKNDKEGSGLKNGFNVSETEATQV